MTTQIERYVVTYVDVDRDGQCDGKPEIGGFFNTLEEAKAWIRSDIEEYIDEHTDDETGECDFIADFMAMKVHTEDWSDYVEWQFKKCTIPLTEAEING